MRFYQGQHRFTCGIDLHAKTMYLCVIGQEGNLHLQQNIPTSPAAFLTAIQPWRECSRSLRRAILKLRSCFAIGPVSRVA